MVAADCGVVGEVDDLGERVADGDQEQVSGPAVGGFGAGWADHRRATLGIQISYRPQPGQRVCMWVQFIRAAQWCQPV